MIMLLGRLIFEINGKNQKMGPSETPYPMAQRLQVEIFKYIHLLNSPNKLTKSKIVFQTFPSIPFSKHLLPGLNVLFDINKNEPN